MKLTEEIKSQIDYWFEDKSPEEVSYIASQYFKKVCKRTDQEILDKIRELSDDKDKFIDIDYGYDGVDEFAYERFDEILTQATLKEFVDWLFEK